MAGSMDQLMMVMARLLLVRKSDLVGVEPLLVYVYVYVRVKAFVLDALVLVLGEDVGMTVVAVEYSVKVLILMESPQQEHQ